MAAGAQLAKRGLLSTSSTTRRSSSDSASGGRLAGAVAGDGSGQTRLRDAVAIQCAARQPQCAAGGGYAYLLGQRVGGADHFGSLGVSPVLSPSRMESFFWTSMIRSALTSFACSRSTCFSSSSTRRFLGSGAIGFGAALARQRTGTRQRLAAACAKSPDVTNRCLPDAARRRSRQAPRKRRQRPGCAVFRIWRTVRRLAIATTSGSGREAPAGTGSTAYSGVLLMC